MKPGAKLLALSTVALGVVVWVGVGIAGKDWIREEWYIWRLGSEDKVTRELAAEKLGEVGSPRVIPHLLEALCAQWSASDYGSAVHILRVNDDTFKLRSPGVEATLSGKSVVTQVSILPGAYTGGAERIVGQRGAASIPYLVEAVRAEAPEIRRIVAALLGKLEDEGGAAVGALSFAANHDDDPSVRAIARYALEQIQGERPTAGAAPRPSR